MYHFHTQYLTPSDIEMNKTTGVLPDGIESKLRKD